MKYLRFFSWVLAAVFLAQAAIGAVQVHNKRFIAQEDAFERKLQKEQHQQYGNPWQEEKEYYEKVAPKNPERDRDYLDKDHPIPEAPLQGDQPFQDD